MITSFAKRLEDGSYEQGAYCSLTWTDNKENPIVLVDSHHGLVMATYERNYHDDSDFYAIVWNPELGKAESILYSTTRGWCYPCGAQADYTDWVAHAYNKWAVREQEYALKITREARKQLEAQTPEVGKKVRVVAGRKIPKGEEALVFWYGYDQYGNGKRVGLELSSGERVFTAAKNVAVLNESGNVVSKICPSELQGAISGASYRGQDTWARLPRAGSSIHARIF